MVPGSLPDVVPSWSAIVKSAGSGRSGLSLKSTEIAACLALMLLPLRNLLKNYDILLRKFAQE